MNGAWQILRITESMYFYECVTIATKAVVTTNFQDGKDFWLHYPGIYYLNLGKLSTMG